MKRWIDATWQAAYILICGSMTIFTFGQFTRYPAFGWHPLFAALLVFVTFFAEVWLLRRSWSHDELKESYYLPLLGGHITAMGLIRTVVIYKQTAPLVREQLGYEISMAIIYSTVPILLIGVLWGIECHYELLWPQRRQHVAERLAAEMAR